MKRANIKNLILTFSLIAAFNAAGSALASELNTLKNVSFTKVSDNNVEIKISTEYGFKEVPKIFEKDKNSYFIALDSTYYKGKKALNIDSVKESIVSASVEYIPYKSKPNEGYTKISVITTDDTLLSVAKLPFNPENRKFKKLIRLLLVLLGSCTIVGSGILVSLTLQNKKRISGLSELDKTEEPQENSNNQTQILNINPEALDYINDSVDLANFQSNFIREEENSIENPQNEDTPSTEGVNTDEVIVESDYQEDLETKNNTIGENAMYPSPDDIVNDVLSSDETVTELSKVVLNEIEDKTKDYTLIQTEEEIDEVFDDLDKEEKVAEVNSESEIIQDEEGLDNFLNEEENEYKEEPAEVVDEAIEETYEEEVYETEEPIEVVDEQDENNIDFKSVQYTPTSGISMFTPKTFVFSTANNNEPEEPVEVVDEVIEETYEEEVYETEEPAEVVDEAIEETYEEEVYETEEPAEVVDEVIEETYEEEVYETEEPAEVVDEVIEETYEEVYETEEPAEVVDEVIEETYEEEVYETEEPTEVVDEVIEETYEEEVYETEEPVKVVDEVIEETYEEEVYETEEPTEVVDEAIEETYEEEIENDILEDIFENIETSDEDLEVIEDIPEEINYTEGITPATNIEQEETFTLSEEISATEIAEAKETFDELSVIMNDEVMQEETVEELASIEEETTIEEPSPIYNARENIIDTLFQDEENEEIQNENIFSEFNIGGFDGIVAEMPTEEELSLTIKEEQSIIEENEISYEEQIQDVLTENEPYYEDEVVENLDEITELQDDEITETYQEEISSQELEENSNKLIIQEEIIISENIEREEDMMLEETPISTEKFFVENDEEEESSSPELFKNEYAYNSTENDNNNDDIFFDDEDTTEDLDDSEPIVVSEKEIENQKQLYLIRHEGKYSLIGTMENEVFVIHKFAEKPSKTRINTKLNESKPNQHIYIVKVDTWRALVSVTDQTMENLLTLS